MKLFYQLILLSGLNCGNPEFGFPIIGIPNKDTRSYYCDTAELELPSNAEKWYCTEATGDLVPAGGRCNLKCDAGFISTACKFKFHFYGAEKFFRFQTN